MTLTDHPVEEYSGEGEYCYLGNLAEFDPTAEAHPCSEGFLCCGGGHPGRPGVCVDPTTLEGGHCLRLP